MAIQQVHVFVNNFELQQVLATAAAKTIVYYHPILCILATVMIGVISCDNGDIE